MDLPGIWKQWHMDRKLIIFIGLLLGVSALAFTPYLPFFGPRDPVVITDWARRVVANGGAMPSQTSIIAMETLRVSLEAQSLTNKIWSLCIFVPDSVIAASTPLVKIKGADPWTNSGFASGDLTIQGLKGNGANWLDTAIIPIALATNNNNITSNASISVVVTESATNSLAAIILDQRFPGGANSAIGLFASGGGSNQYYCGRTGAANNFIGTNDFNRVGYLSGNRSGSNLTLFTASPIESHKLIGTNFQGALFIANAPASSLAFYQTRIEGTNVSSGAAAYLRLSMACLHDGFTEVESSNFWWAVKTCRESLGGGAGEPIYDWARYVTNFGGAAISANTSNALRTFRQGLDTDNLLYKMIAVNSYVPDNLTAARMPILWQTGNQIWTNVLFDATNLTVNGLTGTTNKYLGTGINLGSLGYANFGNSNAGVSLLIYNVPTTASVHDFSGTGSTGNILALSQQNGVASYFCWRFLTVNSNFVARSTPSPGATWAGFLSGSRTASNAIALYWVTNGVFNIATNSTTVQTGTGNTVTNIYAFANHPAGGVAGSSSDHTVSFVALHAGLTQTESSNLWYRVAVLRTNLGGGVP